MTDYLQTHADHARTKARLRHAEALRPYHRQAASMAAYIAGLAERTDRALALAVACEIAPDLADAIEREARNLFELSRYRRRVSP